MTPSEKKKAADACRYSRENREALHSVAFRYGLSPATLYRYAVQNDEEVWEAPRRSPEEFNRLCQEAYDYAQTHHVTQTQAAKKFGLAPSSFAWWQKRYKKDKPKPPKQSNIDLGLALLSRHARPDVCFTQYDIAVWCDCSCETISRIEEEALAKLHKRLSKAGVDPQDFIEHLHAKDSETSSSHGNENQQ